MMPVALEVPDQTIEAFRRKWRIKEFSLFGSVLRDDFRPDSDVDVLVSFDQEAHWGLADLGEMTEELEDIFQRSVDLVEKEGLRNPFRRQEILKTHRGIFAQPNL